MGFYRRLWNRLRGIEEREIKDPLEQEKPPKKVKRKIERSWSRPRWLNEPNMFKLFAVIAIVAITPMVMNMDWSNIFAARDRYVVSFDYSGDAEVEFGRWVDGGSIQVDDIIIPLPDYWDKDALPLSVTFSSSVWSFTRNIFIDGVNKGKFTFESEGPDTVSWDNISIFYTVQFIPGNSTD